jgi:acyl-coenzyme A synthetase/AMP-(fatty) acid ligase
MHDNLYDFLVAKNRASSETRALLDANVGRWYSYRELRQAAFRLSDELRTRTKSLAFVALDNDVESVLVYLACLAAEHAVAVIDSAAPIEALKELIDRYAPETAYLPAAATAPGLLGKYRQLNSSIVSNGIWRAIQDTTGHIHPAVQLLLSTSGSTGSPKFVRLSARNLIANVCDIIEALNVSAGDRAITSLPLSYSYGLSVLNSHLRAGASVVTTKHGIADPKFWSLLHNRACSSFAGVPFSYRLMRKLDPCTISNSSLIKMTQAGGRLEVADAEYFHALMEAKNGQFFVMYGQTEASPRMTTLAHRDFARKRGSVGLPMSSGRVRILRAEPALSDSAAGEAAGEIYFEGPNVMLGYATCRHDLSKGDEMNGVLATGDLGYLDRDGFLYIRGRAKRIGKVLGRRINLDEVESSLGDVGQCAVVEVRDKLIVYLTVGGVGDLVRERLVARFGLRHNCVGVVEIPQLPTLSNGKLDYSALVSLQ